MIDQALFLANEQRLNPLGIGVGVPGLVNVHQGNLIMAPNLHWKDVPLRLMWNQRFHLPIYIENEANLAALGEYYFGSARDVDNFIYLECRNRPGGRYHDRRESCSVAGMDMLEKSDISSAIRWVSNVVVGGLVVGRPRLARGQCSIEFRKELQSHSDQSC